MKNTKIKLNKGEVIIYDFGNIKIHNYDSHDQMNDQVIMLEKNNQIIVIESPAFYDNITELESYLKTLNSKISGMLLSYHMSGATFLKDNKKYATHSADEYGHEGGGKTLIDNFTKAFGQSFDNNIHNVTDYINDGYLTIADMTLNIIPTSEAFDIEIPEINCLYTHMLGSDCHSIIAGVNHANAMLETLDSYLKKDYNLILTSHYIPEAINAVNTKISYIKNLLNIVSACSTKDEMIEKVKKEYSNYSGINYLEMTAGFFFPNNE